MIPYGKQDINQNDIDAVINVLKSDFLTQGPITPLFEKRVSEKVGSNFAVAVNSATSALHIACLALELGKNDLLWTSPNTFVASANCGLYCGANVDFVDINPNTYNICADKLEEKLIHAKKHNKLPNVLVAVHLCGQSPDMERIHKLSKKYNFSIIEDASHSIGAKYQNAYVGCCKYSDITIFSFHPVKIITTAEGGMALTNDPELHRKMKLFSSHGIVRDNFMQSDDHGSWYYEQIELGYNYRITEIQSALGISQLERLDEFVSKRQELASIYNNRLTDTNLKLPAQIEDSYSSFHLYVVRLRLDNITNSHKYIFEQLKKNGIGVNLHYIPVHTHPFYANLGFSPKDFPESLSYYNEAISLPIYPNLSEEQQDKICETLKSLIK